MQISLRAPDAEDIVGPLPLLSCISLLPLPSRSHADLSSPLLGEQDGLTLAKFVKQSPGLARMLRPVANAYANWTGHRQHGLRYDDLIIEENSTTQKVRIFLLFAPILASGSG